MAGLILSRFRFKNTQPSATFAWRFYRGFQKKCYVILEMANDLGHQAKHDLQKPFFQDDSTDATEMKLDQA